MKNNSQPGGTAEQQRAAVNLLQALAQGRQSQPIVKQLVDLGIQPVFKMIELEGMAVECLIVPKAELMLREYNQMCGMDMSAIPSE